MKRLSIILVSGFLIWACDENPGIDEISIQDEEALEGMTEEMSYTVLYNDSLVSYINLTGINNDTECEYFDEHYHYHDSLYSVHHDQYSHSYGWDDHTMGSGGMMHHNDHMSGSSPGGMEHSMSDHDFMDSLHLAHEPYHFGGE